MDSVIGRSKNIYVARLDIHIFARSNCVRSVSRNVQRAVSFKLGMSFDIKACFLCASRHVGERIFRAVGENHFYAFTVCNVYGSTLQGSQFKSVELNGTFICASLQKCAVRAFARERINNIVSVKSRGYRIDIGTGNAYSHLARKRKGNDRRCTV